MNSLTRRDDSDGHFGMLRDRLQDLHYQACQEARPDPVELARRLFQWELHSDFDVFYGAVARYAKILGAKGMKVYQELAEAEWEKVPREPPGTRGPNGASTSASRRLWSHWHRRRAKSNNWSR